MDHFKNICPNCGAISQCRCFNCNKTISHNLCQTCRELLVETLIKEEDFLHQVWICGKDTLDSWELQGIFTTKQKAIEACHDEYYFISPTDINKEFPIETTKFPNIEYPLKNLGKLIIPKLNKVQMGGKDGPSYVECDTGKVSDGYHTFDELYEHRITLYIALCKSIMKQNEPNYMWRSRIHSDGTSFPGWFILGINESSGYQITYHLPESKWIECNFVSTLEKAPKWDGHTPQDVLERIKKL